MLTMLLEVTVKNMDDGEEIEISVKVPAKFEICQRCRGEGKHVNPSIDGNGISREDFDADPDFEEGYFSGRYDIRCEARCEEGKVRLPDFNACTPDQKDAVKAWEKHQEEVAQWDADDRRTRRMESGGYDY